MDKAEQRQGGMVGPKTLAVAASGAQTGIRVIERLVRSTRDQGGGPIAVHASAAREPFMDATREEHKRSRAALVVLMTAGNL